MKLTNPTDDELNAAFAEKVAGWTNEQLLWGKPKSPGFAPMEPHFTRSADAVLPWLEKQYIFEVQGGLIGGFYVGISSAKAHNSNDLAEGTREFEAINESFPRAAVICLLLAHGVEVEFTP